MAACYVAFYHIHEHVFDRSLAVAPFVRHGYIAVDFFFILSGFVMALSYSATFERMSWRNYGVFMTKRAARIYPLYFFLTCLIMAGLLVGIGVRPASPPLYAAFLFNLLLLQNWGTSYSIILASWSISTELAAYVLFPILLALAVKRSRYVAAATLLCSAAAIAIVASLRYDMPHNGPLDVYFDFSPWPMVRCLSEFTIGLIGYRAAAIVCGRDAPAALHPRYCRPALVAVTLGLLFLPGTDLLLITAFTGLIVVIAVDDRPAAWLASRPGLLLGELSYAVYLLHFEFLRIVRMPRDGLTQALGDLGATIVVDIVYFAALLATAWLCFTYIEKPGRLVVRRWARRLDLAPER